MGAWEMDGIMDVFCLDGGSIRSLENVVSSG